MHYIYYRLQTDPEELYILHIPFPNILMYLIVNTSDAPEHAHKPVGIVAIQRIAVIQPRDDDSFFLLFYFFKTGSVFGIPRYGSRSTKLLTTNPISIGIHNTGYYS